MSDLAPTIGVHGTDFTLFNQKHEPTANDLDPILNHLFGLSFEEFTDKGCTMGGVYKNYQAYTRKYSACFTFKNLVNVYFTAWPNMKNIQNSVHLEIKGAAYDCGLADFPKVAEFIFRHGCHLSNWHVYYDVPPHGNIRFQRFWASATATPKKILTTKYTVKTNDKGDKRSIIIGGVPDLETRNSKHKVKKPNQSLIIYDRGVIRLELRLANQVAMEVLALSHCGMNLGEIAGGVIMDMITFRDPKGKDPNMSRRKEDPAWRNIFNGISKLKLSKKQIQCLDEEREAAKIVRYLERKHKDLSLQTVIDAICKAAISMGIKQQVIDDLDLICL